jgi:hypothetical protein
MHLLSAFVFRAGTEPYLRVLHTNSGEIRRQWLRQCTLWSKGQPTRPKWNRITCYKCQRDVASNSWPIDRTLELSLFPPGGRCFQGNNNNYYYYCYYYEAYLFIFNGVTALSGLGPPHYRGFTITLRHTTLGRTPLDERSARHRDLYLTTQNTHKWHSCPGGIRTRNPSKQTAADPRVRPRGHWD